MSFNRRGEWSGVEVCQVCVPVGEGTSPNGVVPMLKAKAEEMKDKVIWW